MNLSLSTSGVAEVEAARHDLLSERRSRGSGARRLGKGTYPRSQFSYSNYNVDPRPDVLKLGYWKHPNTKNTLLGGINLNYLSAGQIARLKKTMKQVFTRGTLRSRYRYIKRKLPDIAQYYRTYDEDYISSDQPDEFKDFNYRDIKEPTVRDVQAKKKADTDEISDLTTDPSPEYDDIEQTDDAVEKGRELWRLKRRLYDPNSGKRAKPERAKIRGSKQAKREKLNRYKAQRRKLKQLTKDAEVERIAARLRSTPTDIVEPQSDLGTYESTEDYYYSPGLGFVWASPSSYMKHHGAETFGLLKEHRGGKVLAVHDMSSGITLFDAVEDHIFILQSAGWDYWHTILMEVDDGELVMRSEISQPLLMEEASRLNYSKIVKVLSE